MWERLADILSNSWTLLSPCVVVKQYELGVVLRFGKYRRDVEPGLRYKIPLIETVLIVEAVQTTMRVRTQTLTTQDGISVTTSAVLQYEIKKPKPFLLEVWEGLDAINDVAMAEIKRVVSTNTWEQLNSKDMEQVIKTEIGKQIKPYGVTIKRFGFADLGKIRTIRIINSSVTTHNEDT